MKRCVFSLVFILFGFIVNGQKTFTIKTPAIMGGDSILIPEGKNSIADSSWKKVGMKINGQEIYSSVLGQKIDTHFPDFDTIFYFNSNIISRFKPDANYVFVFACCGTLDILPEKQGLMLFGQNNDGNDEEGWDERKFDSIRVLYYDQPVPIRFSNKHQKQFKNQCAFSPDASIFPYLVLLEKTKETNWYFVPKGWYRSNFSTLKFFKISDSLLTEFNKYDLDESEEIIEASYIENVNFDATISFRFFHDEKIELEYDPKKKKIGIKIIE